jgi:hypothetical protein
MTLPSGVLIYAREIAAAHKLLSQPDTALIDN